ncbi:hypothetical protein CC2G_000085 [Coprinopsis cinerea AmutBmut pab1-1]|nr:hypothetical protein CC2G_000085 [Coprinopsis cinerea AmutBmut pab1-1]
MKVDIDTKVKGARIYNATPRTTLARDQAWTHAQGTKAVSQNALKFGFKLPIGLSEAVEGTDIKENFSVVEHRAHGSAIRKQESFGRIWWTFDVDDENQRKCGLDVPQGSLPRASLEFFPLERKTAHASILLPNQQFFVVVRARVGMAVLGNRVFIVLVIDWPAKIAELAILGRWRHDRCSLLEFWSVGFGGGPYWFVRGLALFWRDGNQEPTWSKGEVICQ